ncbi:unannotated protein [freshwater metagenome]|uniref:Unannotated protein n=1 Tax=freshwater metagenome TaxID=449393 RepID=A0A6J7L9K0_9ZZZZ
MPPRDWGRSDDGADWWDGQQWQSGVSPAQAALIRTEGTGPASWLTSWVAIAISGLLCFPVALTLVWLRPRSTTRVKIGVTVGILALLVAGGLASANDPPPPSAATATSAGVSQQPATTPESPESPSDPTTLSQAPTPQSTSQAGYVGPPWASPVPVTEEYSSLDDPYIAIVSGFGDPGSFTNGDNPRFVQLETPYTPVSGDVETSPSPQVRSESIKLAMVSPVDLAECGGDSAVGSPEKAYDTILRLMPIGSRVLVVSVDTEGYSEVKVLHLLPSNGDSPDPTPPVGSVNEQLVVAGTWEPNDDFTSTLVKPYRAESLSYEIRAADPRPIVKYSSTSTYPQGSYAGVYWDRIVSAANAAFASTAMGKACRDSFAALILVVRAETKKSDASNAALDRWYAEWLRNRPACRDGDGDGVCNER